MKQEIENWENLYGKHSTVQDFNVTIEQTGTLMTVFAEGKVHTHNSSIYTGKIHDEKFIFYIFHLLFQEKFSVKQSV